MEGVLGANGDGLSIEGPRVSGNGRNVAIGKAVKENGGSVDIDRYLWSWEGKNKCSTTTYWEGEREREREREKMSLTLIISLSPPFINFNKFFFNNKFLLHYTPNIILKVFVLGGIACAPYNRYVCILALPLVYKLSNY